MVPMTRKLGIKRNCYYFLYSDKRFQGLGQMETMDAVVTLFEQSQLEKLSKSLAIL